MSEINSTLRGSSDADVERARRARDFEPDPTPEEIDALGLIRVLVPDPGPHGIPYVFWFERAAAPACPACAAGDHEQPLLATCGCACHEARTPRKPAARVIDYERIGFELATGGAA